MKHHAVVIDDNAMNLETLMLLLQKEGVSVSTFTSPRELENQLESLEQIDIVFLDLEFPNYSGLEFITIMKSLPALAEVPIVAYSVHISELNEVRSAGFHSFIGKPLNISEFPSQLQRILNDEPVWDVGQ